MDIQYRVATEKDIPLILKFIKDLAEYERMLDEVIATEDSLKDNLFGKKAYAEVVFAVYDNIEAGFALFFHNFSTFQGKPGIYLEDLFVKPEYRGKGIGKKLLAYLSDLAKERGCSRLEWLVLDWNPARRFYETLGAKALDDWTVYRLCGADLAKLADVADKV